VYNVVAFISISVTISQASSCTMNSIAQCACELTHTNTVYPRVNAMVTHLGTNWSQCSRARQVRYH